MRVIINGYESHPDNITGRQDIEFISCKERECDIFITLDDVSMFAPIKTICRDGGFWCLPYEPPVERYRYLIETYKYFDFVNTPWTGFDHSNVVIHDTFPILPLTKQSAHEIKQFQLGRKSIKGDTVSAVVSIANEFPGHKVRAKFVNYLNEHEFAYDRFGNGYNRINDKKDALIPYKYSIALENSFVPNYFTEKIGDCFACLTMPIYWGCPNITDFFPTESMILIDQNDFKSSMEIIEEAVRNDHYTKYYDAIVYAKEILVEKHLLYPYICRLIDKYYHPTSDPKPRSCPARLSPKEKKLSFKLKTALGIYKLKNLYRQRNCKS